MKVGLSITSAHPGFDARAGAATMIARAAAAERAQLDSLFVGDHHVTRHPYYQNTPILGRLLAEWGDRPSGALFLLPLWHPVLVAEQTATLASIAKGRFILQCGIGNDDEQFSGLGVDPRHRPSRFEQSLDLLRRLWAGEEVSSDGRWCFESARISPLPPQPIEVWIGAVVPAAVERAARLGDGWIASPNLIPEKARAKLDLYEQYCARHDRENVVKAIRRDVYVGETAAEAERTGGAVVAAGYRGFAAEALVIGDVEQVAATFAELGAMGYTDVIARNLIGDDARAVASTERLGEVRRLVASL